MGASGTFLCSGLPDDVVTAAIRDCRDGIAGAEDRLWGLVYPWFRRLAEILLARDGQRRQLTPEDLLHDAFPRVGLAYLREPDVTRAGLCRWVLQAMRWVLVDCSRRQRVRQRHADEARDAAQSFAEPLPVCDLLDLEDRLDRLARCDARAFHVLEMFLFGHKTLGEIGAIEGYSASKAGSMLQSAFQRMREMDASEAAGGGEVVQVVRRR